MTKKSKCVTNENFLVLLNEIVGHVFRLQNGQYFRASAINIDRGSSVKADNSCLRKLDNIHETVYFIRKKLGKFLAAGLSRDMESGVTHFHFYRGGSSVTVTHSVVRKLDNMHEFEHV